MLKKIALLLAAAASTLMAGTGLEIVRDGKSDYVITAPRKAPEAVRAAVSDLKNYIRKATGADLPVVTPDQVAGRPAFRVGFLKADKPEGFTVKTQGRDIHISGDDTPGPPYNPHWASGARVGSWYGVSDFLEKQLGIRWFFPGPKGEYVPRHTTWNVPAEMNYSEAPAMESRRMGYLDYQGISKEASRENELWLRRNRAGNANSWCAWHSWLHHFKGKDYFAGHPEWFAQVGGRRYGTDGLGHGLQMCTTNREGLDQYAKNLIAYAKAYRYPIMLPLSPNDGGNFCECANCAALDNGSRPDGSKIMTDRMMTYANEVARRVKKEIPGQKFGMYAYGFYVEGVGKVKVDPSITIMEVHNDNAVTYYNPERRAAHLKNLQAWRKNLNQLYFYATPEGMGGLELPSYHFNNIRMLYDNLYAADVTGFDMNNATSFGASGLNNYFYLKFAWAPEKNPEKLYTETLDMCYGKKAAPTMKGYFDDVEKRFEKFANAKIDEDRGMGYVRRLPDVLTQVYPGLAEAWLPELKKAAGETIDPGQKARIQIAIDNLEYCKTTVELHRLAMLLVGKPNPDVKLAAAADQLVTLRERQLKALAPQPSNTCVERVRGTEKSFRLPFDRNVFSYMMAAGARKSAKAGRIGDAPVMDGKLTEDVWKNLPVLRIVHDKDDARILPVGADVKVAVHGGSLYLGIRCEEPLADGIKDSGRGDASPVWNENSLDLFFDPAGTAKGYYQLVFNSLGTCRAFRNVPGKRGVPWAVKPEIATFRGKDFWSAEVKIPLSALTKKKDVRGDIWGFNACRARRTVHPSEYSCWSPTFGDFHRPERFGRLIMQ